MPPNDRERLERLYAALAVAIEENGPYCLVCAEDIEADDDPCDIPCTGHELRKLFVETGRYISETADD